MPSSIEQALVTVARSVDPLIVAMARPTDDVGLLIERLGWSLPSVPPAITGLAATTQSLGASVGAFDLALEADEGADQPSAAVLAALGQVAADVAALISAIGNLPAQLVAQLPPNVIAATQIDQQFSDRLLHTLVDEQLDVRFPTAASVLRLLTLREVVELNADPAHFQPAFTKRTLHFDRLGRLVSDPSGLMRDVYGWGTPALNADVLFDALMSLSFALGSPAYYRYPGHSALEALAPAIDVTADVDLPHELVVPIVILDAGPASAGVAVGLMPAPLRSPGEAQGLVATLLVTGGLTGTLKLNPRTSVSLEAEADLSTGLSAILRPGQAPELKFDLAGGAAAMPSGHVELKLTHDSGVPEQRMRLLTIFDGTYLEAGALTVHARADATRQPLELVVGAALERGRFTLAPSGADSFVARLLPQGGLNVDFDVGVDWSHNGLRLSASGGMETDLALHVQIGPLHLDGMHLALALAGDTLSLEASVRGGAALGPFAASVDRVGAKALLAFHDGNLGPVDLGLQFKPPNGMGLSVDAAVVKGGGYLYFDPDKAEYAGVLELSLKDVIQIKAIGLLTTRMPDGTQGFSLLLLITGEFPPIQLGFGFTLTGVGGLAGVNRTMAVDALRSGLRNHTLDSIMFPEDPVANAPRIISDLRTVFPPAQGRYVFGPMLQLGWGTPTLISAELGVLLELPAPLRIAILGQIKAVLPAEDVPIVQLHIDVLGVIDFERKQLAIDATIYDSSILVYALSGDMALRLDWGDMPSFAVSLGGLHPRFQPPPGFPVLRRLTLSLGDGDNPRISCQTDMALTSNSVQFGARVEAYAAAGGFAVPGSLGFDVLIILSPFSFTAGMEAGVELLRGSSVLMGIHLSFTLSGPTPWHAWGSASIDILFFSISVDFDVSWGDDHQAELPPADARAPLLAALADSRNWHAELPAGSENAVSLGAGTAPEEAVLVHPLGHLTVRQTVVPLDVTITRFGTAAPDHWNHFEVTDVTIGTSGSVPRTPVQDRFARGQFFELSDEDKLGKPAFEPMDAGVAIGAQDERLGHRSPLDVRYETGIVDDVELPLRLLGRLHAPFADAFASHLRFGAVGMSQVLNSGDAKYVVPGTPSAVTVADVRHVIASTDDLTIRADVLAESSASLSAAEGALRAHLRDHPEDAGRLQVVPVHEAVGV